MAALGTGKQMLDELKGYVNGGSNGFQASSGSTVRLTVTHSNLMATFPELAIDRHVTIEGLKDKIRAHCGTSVGSMVLYLRYPDGRDITMLGDDSKMIGFYSPQDGWIVHVHDTDPYSLSANGGLENVNLVRDTAGTVLTAASCHSKGLLRWPSG